MMARSGREFVRRGELLVPAEVVDAEDATRAETLRAELIAARDLAVAQQAEHRGVVATLVEQVTAPRALPGRSDDVDDVEGADAVEAARLREELAAVRDLVAVRAEDAWARRAQAAEHRIAMADVDERAAAAKRERQARARDAAEGEALAVLYQRAARSGARARVRAQIQGSAEMRALRVAAVRKVALFAGLPVLAAFAAWSTTGVQAGVVRLLDLPDRSPAWWASWAVEPALITIVALIIVGRAVLRSSGGDTDWRAGVAEWAALGASLALNIFGGWIGGWSGIAGALPHAIGPLGCAGTAFLIGLFDGYVSTARPWAGAPRLADMDLVPPLAAPVPAVATGPVPVPAVGAGSAAMPSVPARHGGTGPGRTRAAASVAASSGAGTRRRVVASTGAKPGPGRPVPGSAVAKARAYWDAEVAAGRIPTGADLARAVGRANDDNGMFRRYARTWAGEGTGSRIG